MWEYKGTIVNVVDGDTIDVDIDLGFKITTRQRMRLARINTPERGQPGFTEAKDFVKLYMNQPVIVNSKRETKDPYGRYVAEINVLFADGGVKSNLNDLMLTEGLAKPYEE